MTCDLKLALFDEQIDFDSDYLALCEVEYGLKGDLPEWIPLIPKADASGLAPALDGRKFYNTDPHAIVDAFNSDPRDLPLDWEHATEKVDPSIGGKAPAAAWIDRMEVRDGAIWGHVKEWTVHGAESVKTKEYRYISPAILYKKATRVITDVISAGLVNRPGFDMPAIAKSRTTMTEDSAMDRDKLIAMLGLNADATDEQIFASMERLKAGPTEEIKRINGELATANSKIKDTEKELENARSANPTLDKFVPRADYDSVVAQCNSLKKEKEDEEKAAFKAEVEREVDAAMKEGKVTPQTREYHIAACSDKKGLARFKEFAKNAPAVCDPSTLETDPKPVPNTSNRMTDEEKKIAEAFGMKTEDYLKERAEVMQAAV